MLYDWTFVLLYILIVLEFTASCKAAVGSIGFWRRLKHKKTFFLKKNAQRNKAGTDKIICGVFLYIYTSLQVWHPSDEQTMGIGCNVHLFKYNEHIPHDGGFCALEHCTNQVYCMYRLQNSNYIFSFGPLRKRYQSCIRWLPSPLVRCFTEAAGLSLGGPLRIYCFYTFNLRLLNVGSIGSLCLICLGQSVGRAGYDVLRIQ